MTPKEKAQQLRDKFYFHTTITELEEAKECALIVVNEKLEELSEVPSYGIQYLLRINFLEEVKKELIEL
jgi:hypothetical protein